MNVEHLWNDTDRWKWNPRGKRKPAPVLISWRHVPYGTAWHGIRPSAMIGWLLTARAMARCQKIHESRIVYQSFVSAVLCSHLTRLDLTTLWNCDKHKTTQNKNSQALFTSIVIKNTTQTYLVYQKLDKESEVFFSMWIAWTQRSLFEWIDWTQRSLFEWIDWTQRSLSEWIDWTRRSLSETVQCLWTPSNL
jgi:hypothetical protein